MGSPVDTVRKMLLAHQADDGAAFRTAVEELITEERRKNHHVVARELERLLNGGGEVRRLRPFRTLYSWENDVPKDGDRGLPLLQVFEPARSLDELVLRPEVRLELDRFAQEVSRGELLRAHGIAPPSRLLLCGPPGCGKTSAAEAVARALLLPLAVVRFDVVVSSYLGETAANLRKIFDFIVTRPMVVLFDEFDAIAKQRDDDLEHGELKRVVNAFLQLLDSLRGDNVVVAATNHQGLLDSAVWRRFDEVVHLDLPSPEERKSVLLAGLRGTPISGLPEWAAVVDRTAGLSHADLERIAVMAVREAILNGDTSVSAADLDAAVARYRTRMAVVASAGLRIGVTSVPEATQDDAVRQGLPRHPHLEMRIAVPANPARKKKPGPDMPKAPERGQRDLFARDIARRVGQLLTETRRRVLAAGVDPALVVRFGLAPGANIAELTDRLADAGLHVVSVDGDRQAVVAFRADDDLTEFEVAMAALGAGPAAGRKTSKWDVFEFIEPTSVRRWGRDDRLGPRVREGVDVVRFGADDVYRLDLELWHPGTIEGARRSLSKVRAFVEAHRDRDGRVLDAYVGNTLCLLRVALRGREVDLLLEVSEVAEVDLPPTCEVGSSSLPSTLAQPFPVPARPPADGPRVCILDSGITSGHPLLAPFVGHASSVHSSITSPADLHGHGTGVAGVAVFGDLRARVAQGDFSSSITLFSARMLDDGNQLDAEKLVVNQIRAAVERYRQEPYNCRVFNLSFGENQTFLDKSAGRQGIWAEVLDLIAAEFDVLFVVSAGNVQVVTNNAEEAEALITSSGRHLMAPEHRLVDPATAALAITVGAIAERAQTTTPRGAGAGDIRRPVAPNPGDPAPFTRVGPGVSGALKPDFVDDGGNLVWAGFMQQRRIHADEASSVLLLGKDHRHITGWFRHDIGTSLAAPRVSRVAAMLEHDLRTRTGRSPTGNLVRALLGAGAVRTTDVDEHCGSGATTTFTGYGRVDEDFALWSSDQRVVLFSEDELPLDHFAMFEIPVPDEFLALRGKKQLGVAVAYDPPTRAPRAEYLGVSLDFDLFWGADQDVLFEHFRTRTKEEGRHPDVDKFKVDLMPGPGANQAFKWGRGRSTLQVGRCEFQRNSRPNRWWLVVRIRRRWAPREIERQRFAIAVVMESSVADLYARVQAQLRARGRARARG